MRKIIPLLALLTAMCACSSIDCPLNQSVYAHYAMEGENAPLADTLTVIAIRQNAADTTLLNSKVNASTFDVPMSYTGGEDILIFEMTDTNHVTRTDTLHLLKTSVPHFESMECSPVFFHTLTDVSYTTHTIEAVTISKPLVNNDTETNITITFKPRD